jgi:hypothetical protein
VFMGSEEVVPGVTVNEAVAAVREGGLGDN